MKGIFRLNLRMKLIISYFCILLIPIFILGYYLTNNLSRNILDNTKDYYANSAKILNQNLVNRLNNYVDIANNIQYDEKLLNYLNMESDSDYDIYQYFIDYIDPLLKRAQYKENNMLIEIFSDNPRLKFSGQFVNDPDTFASKLKQLKTSNAKIMWNGVVVYNKKPYLSCLAPVYDYIYNNAIIGVVELLIVTDELNSLFNAGDAEDNLIFLYDDRDQLLISNDQGSHDESFDADQAGWTTDRIVNFNRAQYLFLKMSVSDPRLSIKDWHIDYMIPLENLKKSTRQTWTTTIMVSLFCILVSTVLIILLSRNITRRIDLLVAKMRQIRKGNFKISVKVTGKDEIAQLSEHFNLMVRELDHRIQEIIEIKLQIKDAEIKKKISENARNEAQLLALQSQIKPHYLFNTMESIRMHLLLKGDRETADVVQLFAESFRNMTYEAENMVSIRDELRFMEIYFKIQQFCYSEKLILEKEVDEELLSCLIPKFIIQPLIENAIYHGLETKDGPGKITIRITKEQHILRIRLSDNGVGMTADQLAELSQSLQDPAVKNKNCALRNIQKRLKLLYDNLAAFHIQSQTDVGTTVDICIPMEG